MREFKELLKTCSPVQKVKRDLGCLTWDKLTMSNPFLLGLTLRLGLLIPCQVLKPVGRP